MPVSLNKIPVHPGSVQTEFAAPRYCQLCMAFNGVTDKLATYDGRTTEGGRWAYMCDSHMISHGTGVGTGYGQRLIYPNTEALAQATKRNVP